MELFRRQQKVIFFIVTIIIVPSFVIVWGVGGRYFEGQGEMPGIGRVNGQPISYQEFDAFRKRLNAAVGGLALQVEGAPYAGSQAGEYWKYLYAYAILKDAEKADIRVSNPQIGTYIENGHPVLAGAKNPSDPQALAKAVDSFCALNQITRAEFLRGVREWQTISNYVMADSNISAVSDDTVFAYYSLNSAECVVKRMRVAKTASIREKAREEISQKPAEELEAEARAYAAGKSGEDRYRQPAGWRFAYVQIPFVPESSVPQPTEGEIAAAFAQGRDSDYQGKTLEESRELIKANLLRREVTSQTYRNLTLDVDPQLMTQGESLEPSELVKLAQLARYGVTAGDTGPELLDSSRLAEKLPVDELLDLGFTLNWLDRNPASSEEGIQAWKKGFNLEGNPFSSDQGLFRLKLLDYRASEPLPLDDPDGSLNRAILELALADMTEDRADEMVRETIEELKVRLMALMEAKERGDEPPDQELAADFEQLQEEAIPYMRIEGNNQQLLRMTVGDIVDPADFKNPETGESGLEIMALVGRRIPTRGAFLAEPAEVRDRYRQAVMNFYLGNVGFFSYSQANPGMGPGPGGAGIRPSPAIMGSLVERASKGEIFLDPAWTREGDSGS
ncbi:MAG: SurA N-terminal domain-containing protein [Planctomycetota bacterium]|jgi:hypothetical protein|nr:SurA N-terminal domain-containing protein [Planctomycetota bacterium]